MKRKSSTKLTECEEKALVALEAKRIKEKEAKAKKRVKNKKQRLVTLGGQQLPATQTITPVLPPLMYQPRQPTPVEQAVRGFAVGLADQAASMAITYALLNSSQNHNRGGGGFLGRMGGGPGRRLGGGAGEGVGRGPGGGGGGDGRGGPPRFGGQGRFLGRGPGGGGAGDGRGGGDNDDGDAGGGFPGFGLIGQAVGALGRGAGAIGRGARNVYNFIDESIDEFKENRARQQENERLRRLQEQADQASQDLNDIENQSGSIADILNQMSQQSNPSIPNNQHYNHNNLSYDFSGSGFEVNVEMSNRNNRSQDDSKEREEKEYTTTRKKLDLVVEDDEEGDDADNVPLLETVQRSQRRPGSIKQEEQKQEEEEEEEEKTPVKSRFKTFSVNTKTPYAAIKMDGKNLSKKEFIDHLVRQSPQSNIDTFNRFRDEQSGTIRYPSPGIPLVKLDKQYGLNENGIVVLLNVPNVQHPDYPRIGTAGSPAPRSLTYRRDGSRFSNNEVVSYFSDKANRERAKEFYKKVNANALNSRYGRHLIVQGINDENPLIRLNRQFALTHRGRVQANPEFIQQQQPDFSGRGSSRPDYSGMGSSSTSSQIKQEPSSLQMTTYIGSMLGWNAVPNVRPAVAPQAAATEGEAASELGPLLEEFLSAVKL
jgi:hypothetical protein